MNNKKLLLLSSSRVGNTPYLEHAIDMIKDHLNFKSNAAKELLFIPYAGVTINYDEYTEMVQAALSCINVKVIGIHTITDPVNAVQNAQAIAIGGGNTFNLLHQLYENKLISPIQQRVKQGIPYIGWSAGSNVAGSTIRTTNDMPIIEPESFNALNLLDIQLNPHYTDHNPPGHNGETRAQRLTEFMVLNPQTAIVAIVEGTALNLIGDRLRLIGSSDGYIFIAGKKQTITNQTDLDYLLTK